MKDIVTNVCIWKVIYPREGREGIVPINTQKKGEVYQITLILYCIVHNTISQSKFL